MGACCQSNQSQTNDAVATNTSKSDEKVSEVGKSRDIDTTPDNTFTGIYCRGIQTKQGHGEQQLNDITTSINMCDYFIFDNLGIIDAENASADVPIGSLDGSNCAGIRVINGQVEIKMPDPNEFPIIKTILDWAPLLRSKGVKYIGFDFEDPAWEILIKWYTNKSQYATAISNLLKNIKALADNENIKLNLIDSDSESTTSNPNIVQVHIDFFSDIYQQCGINTFTAAPYQSYVIQKWIDIAIGLCKNSKDGKALMKWWNYQAYGGGTDVTPWTDAIMKNYPAMGLTEDEAKKFLIVGISPTVGPNPNDWAGNYPWKSDGSNIIAMQNCIRGLANIGGAFIWQWWCIYNENNASITVNWCDLYCSSMKECLKQTKSLYVENYYGRWKCITSGPSDNYTYIVTNDSILIANNNGENIRTCGIKDILSDGKGFTWEARPPINESWTHRLITDSNGTIMDHDSYNGGINWTKDPL